MIRCCLGFCLLLLAARPYADGLFQGRLQLAVQSAEIEVEIQVDRYRLADTPTLSLDTLPTFDFEFVSDGKRLVPVRAGPIATEHSLWEYLLGAGRVERVDGALQLSVPLSLQQRNQNCIHNGVLKVSVDRLGQGAAEFRIASETCIDLKLNFSASMTATYRARAVESREEVIASDRRNLAARMPVKPIAELARRGWISMVFPPAG